MCVCVAASLPAGPLSFSITASIAMLSSTSDNKQWYLQASIRGINSGVDYKGTSSIALGLDLRLRRWWWRWGR